jgi:hypothetical protein
VRSAAGAFFIRENERGTRPLQHTAENSGASTPTLPEVGAPARPSAASEAAALFTVRDQREPGWFFVDNEIIDRYSARLGAYGLAVYAVLCRHCNNSTQQVRLSQRDIGAILGISQDRVRKSLEELAESGLVHVEVPSRPAPGMISAITLLKVKRTGRGALPTAATERHTFSSTPEPNAIRSVEPPDCTARRSVQKDGPRARKPKLETKTENPEGEGTPSPLAQRNFDERDLRLMGEARRALLRRGAALTEPKLFEEICRLAGVTVARGLELEELQKQWPGGRPAEKTAGSSPAIDGGIRRELLDRFAASSSRWLELVRAASAPPRAETAEDDPWKAIRNRLQELINPHSFQTWLAPTRLEFVAGEVLAVSIPTEEFRYARQKFSAEILASAAELGFQDVEFFTPEEVRVLREGRFDGSHEQSAEDQSAA